MRKLGVEEWLIRTVQALFTNTKSSVQVNGQYSSWFDVRVGVYQGSVLSLLLFIIIMEIVEDRIQLVFSNGHGDVYLPKIEESYKLG